MIECSGICERIALPMRPMWRAGWATSSPTHCNLDSRNSVAHLGDPELAHPTPAVELPPRVGGAQSDVSVDQVGIDLQGPLEILPGDLH